jgi:probable O-glycosylation ligase (exosortase A-associated)
MKGLLFTYAATLLGAILAPFYPLIGLTVFIGFAIVQPPSMWYWSVPPKPYAQIVGVAMLVGWAIKGFGSWRFERSMPLVLALVGFLVWAVVSNVLSNVPQVGWPFVESVYKIVIPFMVGLTLIDTPGKLRGLIWTLVGSQGYVAYELNQSYYAGVNRLCTDGFAGMDNNYVAVAMVTGTGLAFFLGMSEKKIYLKAIAFLAMALMAHTIMFSFSRGGMLALIITGVATFLLMAKKPQYVLAFMLALLLALRLAGPDVRQRFSSVFVEPEERDRSASSRLDFWVACWDVMQKEPLTGVGPNQWPIAADAYGYGGIEAHSLWMQVGAELGFPGLIILAAFYGYCIVRLYPLTRKNSHVPDPWFRDVSRMVIASLAGFFVAAQFVSISGLELPYYVVLIGAVVLKLSSSPDAMPWGAAARARPYGLPVMAQGYR